MNDNEIKTYKYLWDAANMVLREKNYGFKYLYQD